MIRRTIAKITQLLSQMQYFIIQRLLCLHLGLNICQYGFSFYAWKYILAAYDGWLEMNKVITFKRKRLNFHSQVSCERNICGQDTWFLVFWFLTLWYLSLKPGIWLWFKSLNPGIWLWCCLWTLIFDYMFCSLTLVSDCDVYLWTQVSDADNSLSEPCYKIISC